MHESSEIGIKFNGFDVRDAAGSDFALPLVSGALSGIGSFSDLARGAAQIARILGRDGELSEVS